MAKVLSGLSAACYILGNFLHSWAFARASSDQKLSEPGETQSFCLQVQVKIFCPAWVTKSHLNTVYTYKHHIVSDLSSHILIQSSLSESFHSEWQGHWLQASRIQRAARVERRKQADKHSGPENSLDFQENPGAGSSGFRILTFKLHDQAVCLVLFCGRYRKELASRKVLGQSRVSNTRITK